MSDRSLPATPRKMDKARRQGQVARSPELLSEAILLWGLMVLSLVLGGGGALRNWFGGCLQASLQAASEPVPGPQAARALALGLVPGLGLLALMAG